MENKIKILLTGAYGFLGSEILKYLLLSDHLEVKTLGNNSKCDFVFDLSYQPKDLLTSFDIVIHVAGKAHINPKTKEETNLIYDVNVRGTKNLLESLNLNKPPKQFIFISSVSVYGLTEGTLITEETPLSATDPYGKSKIEAEEIVRSWCDKQRVVCTIFRLPLVVGINPPGNLGSMIKGIKYCYYFNISGGIAKKSMVLASDIAKYVLIASEVGGIYNLTDGIHPTFKELSNEILQKLGKSFVPNIPIFMAKFLALIGDIIEDSFPINSNKLSKITSTLTFDDSKARNSFGWNPTSVLKGFKLHYND